MATTDSRMSIVDIDQMSAAAAITAINAAIEVLELAGFVVREQRVIKLGPARAPKEYVLLLGVLPSHLDHSDSAAHDTHLKSAQSRVAVPLPLMEADGTVLAAYSAAPTPGFAVTDSKTEGIYWGAHANPDPVITGVDLPQDLDDSADIVVHILASKVGATIGDAVTFDVGAFFQTVGATHDADADAGGTSSAMTGDAATKTVQEETLTIDAADVPAAPCKLTLTYQPTDGTLGTDDVIVHSMWLEYTPQLLTS